MVSQLLQTNKRYLISFYCIFRLPYYKCLLYIANVVMFLCRVWIMQSRQLFLKLNIDVVLDTSTQIGGKRTKDLS